MVSLLATQAELAGITDLDAVMRFTGLEDAVWTRFLRQLGTPPSVRVLAMVPASVLQRPISGLRVPSGPPPVDGAEAPTREASVTETIQMALAWRVARQAIGLEDMGPMLPGCTSSSAVTPSVSAVPAALAATVGGVVPVGATPTQKVVKMSNVIDQTDDTVIATKTRAEMGIHYENHREVTGSEPLPESEPTTDLQVAAI